MANLKWDDGLVIPRAESTKAVYQVVYLYDGYVFMRTTTSERFATPEAAKTAANEYSKNEDIDTSEIPELDEEWFQQAKLKLPTKQLSPDIVDRVAKEVAAQLIDHIETMYPEATKAIAWNSASKSFQGCIRNNMNRCGNAAESGDIDKCLKDMRQERLKLRRLRKNRNKLVGP